MKRVKIFFIVVLVLTNIHFIFAADEINLIYPNSVSVGEEFDINLNLINFNPGVYDVKIEILDNSHNIAEVLLDNKWKSCYYWINGGIYDTETKTFKLKISENYNGINNFAIKIRGTNFSREFGGYQLNILPKIPDNSKQEDTNPSTGKDSDNSVSDKKSKEVLLNIGSPDQIVNGENLEINVDSSNLKDKSYDVKAAISDANDKIISQTYDGNNWISSNNYLKKFFEGPDDSGKIKLRIKDSCRDFSGIGKIVVRLRENGASGYEEKKEDIEILEAENKTITDDGIKNNKKTTEAQNKTKQVKNSGKEIIENDEVISLGNPEIKQEKINSKSNVVYESNNELIKKYSIYGFAILCIMLLCLLLFWKFTSVKKYEAV